MDSKADRTLFGHSPSTIHATAVGNKRIGGEKEKTCS
jgi:hypothetical protein